MTAERTNILFIAANPLDTDRLRVDEESREIEAAVAAAQYRDQFVFEKQYATRAADLQRLLLKYRPQIVHFSSHGSAASEIVLEDEHGNAFAVPATALNRLFAFFRPNIRCVVLNACYSEQQAAGIAGCVDCVVGMSSAIGDTAAIAFSTTFYQALAYGQTVQAAFDQACLQIDLLAIEEGATPRLIAAPNVASAIVFTRPVTPAVTKVADAASDAQFRTTIEGGQVGQVINIDKLDGGLIIG